MKIIHEHGFVTAAHCLPKIGMKIKYGRDGDLYFGVVRDVKLNTTSDVAFVAVDYTTCCRPLLNTNLLI